VSRKKRRRPLDSVRVQLPVWLTDDDLYRHVIQYLPEDADARDVWPTILRHLKTGAAVTNAERRGRPLKYPRPKAIAALEAYHQGHPGVSWLIATARLAAMMKAETGIPLRTFRNYTKKMRWD
jgi:hypothetical protein